MSVLAFKENHHLLITTLDLVRPEQEYVNCLLYILFLNSNETPEVPSPKNATCYNDLLVKDHSGYFIS